jgi:hypothetical protein
MTTISYSLDDVNTIKNKGFNFKLSKATQELIMELSKLVGSPDYIKTPIFQKKKPGSEPDWNLLKQFKPTAKVERTDNEVLLQKIKGSLNKMTDKNYDSMRDEIMVNLGKLENTDLIQTVNDTIFNIASSNRFYSYIYAMHDKLCNLTLEHKFNEEHKQTIIEISENMFVMMKSGRPLFKDSGHLKLMNDKIAAISKLNVKQHPGLSNKACFKFMDIIDIKD